MLKKVLCLPLLVLFLLLLAFTVTAQQPVSGVVIDAATKIAVANATIFIKSSKIGTTTDTSGHFILKSFVGDILEISSVGYTSFHFTVEDFDKQVEIFLQPASNSLSGVVVVGYQTQKRKVVTSAVSSVQSKDIENLPSASFDQLLQGKVAGLNVQNTNGTPGGAPTFVVRGNTQISRSVDGARALSSPLFIIDGIPVSTADASAFDNTGTNYLAGINPNDIETIDVLKDAAAAAIYGSRGANGVIIIKTKRGKSGRPQINISGYAGFSELPAKQSYIIGAEERRAKLDYLTARANDQQRKDFPMMLTDSLNPAFNNAVDWQSLFYQKGIIKNIDFSVAGAKDNMDYRIAANLYDEQGIVVATGFKRYTLSAAIGLQMTPKFKVESLFRASRGDRSTGRGTQPSEPALPISGGSIPSSLFYLSDTTRQNLLGSFESSKDLNLNDDITGSITLNYDVLKTLHVRLQASIQSSNNSRDQFRPSALDANDLAYSASQKSTYQNYNVETIADYTTTFSTTHNFNFLVGNTVNFIQSSYTGVGGYTSGNNVISTVSGIAPEFIDFGVSYSDIQKSGLLSYFGRASYNYKEKYLLSVTWRADASSRFGADSRWGYFPSISAGWNVADEAFLQASQNWLTALKIRGSYGVTGNLPDAYYLPYNSYSINQGGYGGSSATTYNGVNAITPNFDGGVAQKGLTWEQSLQSNIGIDATLFSGRLQLSADAYNRGLSRKLFDLALPVTGGFVRVNTNAVSVRNIGFEFNLYGKILNPTNDLQWNSRLVFSFNKNQIVKLPDGNRDIEIAHPYYGDPKYILTKGMPINTFYLIKSNGVFANDADVPINPYTGQKETYWVGNVRNLSGGDYNWQDQNGDYDVWAGTDQVRAGNPNPRVTGGFTNDFSYKNFTLQVFTTFVLGREIFNRNITDQLQNYQSLSSFVASGYRDINSYDTWKKPGDIAKYAEVNPYGKFYYQFLPFADTYIENGSYARIKYINLAYTFQRKLLDKMNMRNLQVYVIIDNVRTFQKSSIPDAENVDAMGVFSGDSYPLPRKITFGVNIGL